MMITKKEFWILICSLIAILMAVSNTVSAMNLDEYLAQVQQKHRTIRSLEISRDSAIIKKDSNDLDLSSVLTMNASYVDDKKINGMPPSLLIPHQQIRDYSLGLGKKFTTGMQAQVSADVMQINQDSIMLPTNTFSSNEFGVAGLGLSFQQSLWKDSFGHSTRLRLAREQVSSQMDSQVFDLQLKQLLIEAESAFWDLIYLQDELSQRQSSLERAKKIESWVKKRLGNGIGDRADVLNAQGLAAAREFQLVSTQDELVAAQKKIADILEIQRGEKAPDLKGDLSQVRGLSSYLSENSTGRIVRLDSYLAVLEARAKSLVSEEVDDGLLPDLVLQGAYKTNSFQDSITGAMNKASNTDTPTASVGLKLTWLLDSELKDHTRKAAKMEALAASLKQERKLLESDSLWSEINRRHQELSKRIEVAGRINQIQTAKATAERDKLSKGRTVTSQVVIAEQDAAEAELTLAKLKAEQRKLEAQARLFVKIQN